MSSREMFAKINRLYINLFKNLPYKESVITLPASIFKPTNFFMKRRQLLQSLTVATAGAILFPACVADPKKVSIALNRLKITGDEETLLADLADTLVPTTDTPGAKVVGAHLFALVMIDDCQPAEKQEKFLIGMRSFDQVCQEKAGKKFSSASVDDRLSILKAIEEKMKELPEESQIFYQGAKYYILQGYQSSEHFLTNVKPYKLVPGPVFKGCVPANSNA
jgi:hypothetical protein